MQDRAPAPGPGVPCLQRPPPVQLPPGTSRAEAPLPGSPRPSPCFSHSRPCTGRSLWDNPVTQLQGGASEDPHPSCLLVSPIVPTGFSVAESLLYRPF